MLNAINNSAVQAARDLKELLTELSPLIEEYTSRVCPECREICCKQKRSFPDRHDSLYYRALDRQFPEHDPALHPEGPCQFMGAFGCSLPRWLRPWRCTWYFCDSLLEALNNGPQKKARRLSSLIQQIVDCRANRFF